MSWFLKNDVLKILDATQEERDKLQNHNIYQSIKDINQFDTFRIDIRSKILANYLEKV